MIKKIIGVFLVLSVCSALVSAQEKQEQQNAGLSAWLKSLQKKLDAVSPKKTMPMTTGVAGVRGAKEENNKTKLYWKGKKGDEAVTEEELKEFKEAVAFAEKGDINAAVREIEEFMKQYPNSPLIPDAKKTLDLVKTDVKEAKPAQ